MKFIQPQHRVSKLRTGVMAATVLSAMNLGYANLAQAQEDAMEEVVITGSRIVRRDLQAASPIVTVGSQSFGQGGMGRVQSPLPVDRELVRKATGEHAAVRRGGPGRG